MSDANISLNQALFKDGDSVKVTDNTADDNGDIASVNERGRIGDRGFTLPAGRELDFVDIFTIVGHVSPDGSDLMRARVRRVGPESLVWWHRSSTVD